MTQPTQLLKVIEIGAARRSHNILRIDDKEFKDIQTFAIEDGYFTARLADGHRIMTSFPIFLEEWDSLDKESE